jgi:hypothetical protein
MKQVKTNYEQARTKTAERVQRAKNAIARRAIGLADQKTRGEITSEGIHNLGRGRWPLDAFLARAETSVIPTHEVAAVRPNLAQKSFDMLLIRRPGDDPIPGWRSRWHAPGNAYVSDMDFPSRRNGRDFRDLDMIHNQVFATELPTLDAVGHPIPMWPVIIMGERGAEITTHQLQFVKEREGTELPQDSQFFEIRNVLRNPPDFGFIERQQSFIEHVAEVLGTRRFDEWMEDYNQTTENL